MMMHAEWQERTQLLLGDEGLQQLKDAKVLVVGLGGVGAYAAEMLCRAGVGSMRIIDGDIVNPSNRNRQLLALESTSQQSKAELMKTRLLDINPELKLRADNLFVKDELTNTILDEGYDYVVDAIDTLAPKIFLIRAALERSIPIVSSMGAGGKTNPAFIKIDDFSKTYNDKLARMLRKRMHKMGIRKGFKVVFSSEQINPETVKFVDGEQNKKTTAGTISYMPAIFGCFLASEVLRDLAEIKEFSFSNKTE